MRFSSGALLMGSDVGSCFTSVRRRISFANLPQITQGQSRSYVWTEVQHSGLEYWFCYCIAILQLCDGATAAQMYYPA